MSILERSYGSPVRRASWEAPYFGNSQLAPTKFYISSFTHILVVNTRIIYQALAYVRLMFVYKAACGLLYTCP
jgi:hypothetical protein